jgi:hypothetical protein
MQLHYLFPFDWLWHIYLFRHLYSNVELSFSSFPWQSECFASESCVVTLVDGDVRTRQSRVYVGRDYKGETEHLRVTVPQPQIN